MPETAQQGRLKLPPELISLVQHLELNRVGWWDVALNRLVIAALWIEARPVSRDELSAYFQTHFFVEPDVVRLEDQIAETLRVGDAIELPDRRLKLTERAFGRFEAEIRDSEALKERVKVRFDSCLSTCCPQLVNQNAWDVFNDTCLLPWVRSTGARTYTMVSGDPFDIEKMTDLEPFFARFEGVHREGLRKAISSFFDPMTADVRAYVLSYLGALFVLESSSLSPQILAKVLTPSETVEFRIFLDTNFIFSMLGFHDNPGNEAAASVANAIRAVGDRVKAKLYVTPLTVDEAKRALYSRIAPLQSVTFSNAISSVATRELSGVEQRFMEAMRRAGRKLDPDEYFGTYLHDLVPVLRTHGIELFNESMEPYRLRQDVIDDVNTRLAFEKRHFADKARTYEQLVHDVILWHFVRDRRPAAVESALDARVWILTLDYHLLGFDSYKTKPLLPLCFHPASFVQLLQFWVPRSPQFEEALLGSLGLASMFRSNSDTERVTIQILNALSRFENAEELSEETVGRVLLNETLRRKLRATRSVQREVELVREALVDENNRIASALASSARRERDLSGELTDLSARTDELKNQRDATEAEKRRIEQELETQRRANEYLQSQRDEIAKALESEMAAGARRKKWFEYGIFGVSVTVITISLIVSFDHLIPRIPPINGLRPQFIRAIAAALSVIVWVLLVSWIGNRFQAVKQSTFFERFVSFEKWLLGGGGVGAIAVTLLYDYFKGLY